MATDDQDRWLLRVLGIDVATLFDASFLNERLTAIVTDVKLYNAAQLTPAVREAAAALKARRPDAEALIAALEEEVAQAGSAFRRGEARQETAKGAMGKAGVVAFAKMRLRWEKARSSFDDAVANMTDGLRALLQTDEFQDDPRSYDSDVPALIDALASKLPRLDDVASSINDALDAAGGPGERAAHLAAATRAIAGYEAKLAAFDDLREFESTEAGSFPTISLIESSLAELKGALSAAQASITQDREAESAA